MTPSVNQSAIKGLVGKKMSMNVKFMETDIKITKLSVAQIKEIQELVRAQKAREEDTTIENKDEDDGLSLVKFVVKTAVEGGDQLSDEDFEQFSMDDLTTLSNDIMKFSGMGDSGN